MSNQERMAELVWLLEEAARLDALGGTEHREVVRLRTELLDLIAGS